MPTPVGPTKMNEPIGRVGIFESGAGAADGVGDDGDGVGLANHAFVQLLLDAQQARLVVFEHAADGDAGHLADQFGDVAFVDGVALIVFGVPVVAAGLDFRLDGEQLLLDPGGGLVVLALGGGLLLLLQLVDAAPQFDNPRGRRLVVDHETRGGFVDQVDGLVGQVPFGEVALGEADGGRRSPLH